MMSIFCLPIRIKKGSRMHGLLFPLILHMRVWFYRNKKTQKFVHIYSEFLITNISVPNNLIVLNRKVFLEILFKSFCMQLIVKYDFFEQFRWLKESPIISLLFFSIYDKYFSEIKISWSYIFSASKNRTFF